MIMSICSNGDVLSIMKIVRIVIDIIKIVVPIILIMSLMINYINGIVNNDQDSLQKANKNAVPKIVAAALIFFVPTFVNLIAKVANFSPDNYLNCIKSANSEGIKEAYVRDFNNKLANLKKSFSKADYDIALKSLNKIKDENLKAELEKELLEMKKYVDLKSEIEISVNNNDRSKYKKLYEEVENISDSEIKEQFIKLLENLFTGKPLLAESGTFYKTDENLNMDYFITIPPEPTTQMPLIVFLHGAGESENFKVVEDLDLYKFVKSNAAYEKENFIYFAPHWSYNSSITTNDIDKLVKAINAIADEYQVDKNRILLMGFSLGSIASWQIIERYPNLFAAAMPISGEPYTSINPSAYKIPIWAIAGGSEYSIGNNLKQTVDKINAAGGNAKFEFISTYNHPQMQAALGNIKYFNWLLEQ